MVVLRFVERDDLLQYARTAIVEPTGRIAASVAPTIFTIGHGLRPISALRKVLADYDIETLIDVRWNPVSRMNPQMTRDRLTSAFQRRPRYVYGGKVLGNPTAFGERHVPVTLYAKALDALVAKAAYREKIALLCSEVEVEKCHRHFQIGRDLDARNVIVCHIGPSGEQTYYRDPVVVHDARRAHG